VAWLINLGSLLDGEMSPDKSTGQYSQAIFGRSEKIKLRHFTTRSFHALISLFYFVLLEFAHSIEKYPGFLLRGRGRSKAVFG
jgi:hypothetical protein